MRPTVYRKITREKLGRVLPKGFDEQIPASLAEPITAIVFKDRVVTSRTASKALDRIGADFSASLVLVARDFTREVSDLAVARGITVVTSNGIWGGYFWSDERLAESRTPSATGRSALESHEKDESICRLLARLEANLGKDAFHVVDHWEADQTAVGIARPDNHDVLVYIATYGQEEDLYFVSFERPTAAGGERWKDHPYTPAGEEQVQGFDKLLGLIRRHFAWHSEPVSAN